MHIHGNFMNAQSVGLNTALNSERAAAAQRAAETRRKLLKKAQDLNGGASSEETLLVGERLDGRPSEADSEILPGDEYHPGSPGRDSEFG